MASAAYPGSAMPPPPRGHHQAPPPNGPPPPGGAMPPGLASPAAPVPPPTKRHRASDSPATQSQSAAAHAAVGNGTGGSGAGGPPPSSSLQAPPPQRGYVQQGYYSQASSQQQQPQQPGGYPGHVQQTAHPPAHPPAQPQQTQQAHAAGPSAMDTSSSPAPPTATAASGMSAPSPGPSLASPAVDEAIARRRAELRRLQALRQSHPTPPAPPRGGAASGGDALSEVRSHLADRRALPSASSAAASGVGGGGRLTNSRDAAPLRSRNDGAGASGIGSLLPGPPPDRNMGARRTSSLYGRGGPSSGAEGGGDGFGDDGNNDGAAAAGASKPSHPPLTKRPSPPSSSSAGKPRSSSAPPRRMPVPPPGAGPSALSGHHAAAGIVATTAMATGGGGSGGKAPQPPPPRVSFGHGQGVSQPPPSSVASPPNNTVGGMGAGEVGGPSPPAARRLNLSPLDKQPPQQPPPTMTMTSNEPPKLESEPPHPAGTTSTTTPALSSPSSSGPPPPVTTPFGITDTIRKADRVLQDDVPTPKSRTGYTPDNTSVGGTASGSVVSGLTNDNIINNSSLVSPPPTMPSIDGMAATNGSGSGVGGIGGIGSARSTSSRSTASTATSRKEVLTSMFLGADSPAVKSGGVGADNNGSGVGIPQDGRPQHQQQQQQSTELRLIKELRKTKEDNVQNLRHVTRLEAEVSTLRSGSIGASGSSTHIPALSGLGASTGRSSADLQTLVQIAKEDGEAKAIQWASDRLDQQKHSRSSTSLNSIGFSSPTPGVGMMMSPLTSPRERGTMTDAGGDGSGGNVGVGTPGMRKRILTPHPRRRRPAAGDDEGASLDPERDLLVKAAESIPHEFVSDLATYYVRVPYVSSQPDDVATPGSSDPWELHGVAASTRFYADVADANRPATVEVMARIVSDGSVAVLHDACSFRHETAGGNGSNDFRHVDSMDGPLGCVMYIDVDGTEREYWLDAIYEEAQATRDAYCSSLLSAASALKAAAPSLAAVTAAAAASSAPPTDAPPALMPPSQFPAPMQPMESLPPPQKSPTSDACVGTEEISFPPPEQMKKENANQIKSEPKPAKKPPAPVEFEDDGSGSTDALSMMLGFIFETVFGIIYFFLIGLPVRVVKYSIILVVLYVTLATAWLYLADDNGAMDMGAMVNFAGAYQQSLW